MTVSRVVQGTGCVKPGTRARVEKAIAELGYRPDPMLRGLAVYRTKTAPSGPVRYRATLAFLDCDEDEYSLSMFEQTHEAATPAGYSLKYFKLPRTETEQRAMSRRFWMQGIRGLLFGPSREERYIGGFRAEVFSMVGIGEFHHSPRIDSVGADYFHDLNLAASQCYKHGARRIGLAVPSDLEARTDHLWLGAYLAFCHRHKMTPLVLDGERISGELVKWAKREKLDTILGLQGVKIYKRLLPKVQFVALNDWLPIEDGWYVRIPREQFAREAVRLLDYNLMHQRYGIPEWPRHVSIEGEWRT